MHFAILLRGQIRRNKNISNFKHEFIYTKTINSFKEAIANSLSSIGHTFDLYASVKASHLDEDNQNFLDSYQFKKYIFNQNTTQYDDLLTGLIMIKESSIKYDMILVTRVDLLYKRKLNQLDVDYNKFNFCWREPLDNIWICDNIYIFPSTFLDRLIRLYSSNKKRFVEKYFGQCGISLLIIKEFGPLNINFLFNNLYFSGTSWNNKYCNNPLYIIYGYDYAFAQLYD